MFFLKKKKMDILYPFPVVSDVYFHHSIHTFSQTKKPKKSSYVRLYCIIRVFWCERGCRRGTRRNLQAASVPQCLSARIYASFGLASSSALSAGRNRRRAAHSCGFLPSTLGQKLCAYGPRLLAGTCVKS
jgi:hypothetical protein